MSLDLLIEELGYRRLDVQAAGVGNGSLLQLGYDALLLRVVCLALNERVDLPPAGPLSPAARHEYERALARAGYSIGAGTRTTPLHE
jgi:hypothetical protein